MNSGSPTTITLIPSSDPCLWTIERPAPDHLYNTGSVGLGPSSGVTPPALRTTYWLLGIVTGRRYLLDGLQGEDRLLVSLLLLFQLATGDQQGRSQPEKGCANDPSDGAHPPRVAPAFGRQPRGAPDRRVGALSPTVGHDAGMVSAHPAIAVGGIYEDCSYHPCLCTVVDGDNIEGISLIDGSSPRSCSLVHCGPTALTLAEAVVIKKQFQRYVELRSTFEVHEATSQLS